MERQTDAELDAQIDAWYEKYGNAPEAPHAEFVDIDNAQRLMIIRMSNGRRVVIPLEDLQGLADATPEQLEQWEMLGLGSGMDWPDLNVSFSIEGLLQGSYGNQLWMQKLRQKGGAARSEVKQKASRANGTKGGRPKKVKVPEAAAVSA
jgi:hypothetical protein